MDRTHETDDKSRDTDAQASSDEGTRECECPFRMLRRVETRIHNPRCPVHGRRGFLRLVR